MSAGRLPQMPRDRDPLSTTALIDRYMEWMAIGNYSETTVRVRRENLSHLDRWLRERGIRRPQEVTKPVLERFRRYLFYYRQPGNEKPLSFYRQYNLIQTTRSFFRWLAREDLMLFNPASELPLPRPEKRLPVTLTAAEVEAILSQPDLLDPVGLRDRAMLETLYSTGMRRTELVRLMLYDVERDRGLVRIRLGKGSKDRIVPIGERALYWIDRYTGESRPQLLAGHDPGALFLGVKGDALQPNTLTILTSNYVKAAGIAKKASCHTFRHTMATLMLEGGADVRYIQAMLGHAELRTTEIYTRLSVEQLKQVHALTHPAQLKPQAKPRDDSPFDEPSRAAREETL